MNHYLCLSLLLPLTLLIVLLLPPHLVVMVFTCDTSLMVENENLTKEANKLTHTLAKAYGGEDRLLMCLIAKELLSTKRDWAIPPRKVRWPLLLTRLVL